MHAVLHSGREKERWVESGSNASKLGAETCGWHASLDQGMSHDKNGTNGNDSPVVHCLLFRAVQNPRA